MVVSGPTSPWETVAMATTLQVGRKDTLETKCYVCASVCVCVYQLLVVDFRHQTPLLHSELN